MPQLVIENYFRHYSHKILSKIRNLGKVSILQFSGRWSLFQDCFLSLNPWSVCFFHSVHEVCFFFSLNPWSVCFFHSVHEVCVFFHSIHEVCVFFLTKSMKYVFFFTQSMKCVFFFHSIHEVCVFFHSVHEVCVFFTQSMKCTLAISKIYKFSFSIVILKRLQWFIKWQ